MHNIFLVLQKNRAFWSAGKKFFLIVVFILEFVLSNVTMDIYIDRLSICNDDYQYILMTNIYLNLY